MVRRLEPNLLRCDVNLFRFVNTLLWTRNPDVNKMSSGSEWNNFANLSSSFDVLIRGNDLATISS